MAIVGAWSGMTIGPGRYGAVTFRYGSGEVGHLHGNSHADLPFPTRLRHVLVAFGAADPHRYMPASGWVTVPLDRPDGTASALVLFALNDDLIARRHQPYEAMPEG